MKRCPSCNSTFDDEYLSFCTNDGTVLVEDEVAAGLELKETVLLSEPPVTAIMLNHVEVLLRISRHYDRRKNPTLHCRRDCVSDQWVTG